MLRVLVLVAVVVGVTPVRADTPAGKPAALKLFAEADKAYKHGDFERAAQLLREAYDLYPEPILLYNLARALEGTGDIEGAVVNYERYLGAATTVEDRGAIERRVVTLKQQIATKEKALAKDKPPPKPEPPPPAAALTPPPSAPHEEIAPPPRHSVVPWVVVGLGAAAGGVGAYFGTRAKSEHDAAVSAMVQIDAQQHQAAARDDAGRANALFIAGGVLTAGGVVWAIIDRSRGSRSKVSLQVHPRGFAVAWDWP